MGEELDPTKPYCDQLLSRAEEVLRRPQRRLSDEATTEIRVLIDQLRAKHLELEAQTNDLRRTRLELQEARNRYSNLYENSPIGYVTLDATLCVAEANVNASQLLNVAREQLIGVRLATLIHPQHHDAFHFFCQRVRESGKRQICDVRLAAAHGLITHLRLDGVPDFPDHGHLGNIRLVVHDITQQHRTEEVVRTLNVKLQHRVDQQTSELRRVNRELEKKIQETDQINQALLAREAKLNSILNATVDGIITIDQHGLIESFNAGAEAIFGYNEEQILGRSMSTLMDQGDWEKYSLPIINGRPPIEAYNLRGITRELEGRRRDGSVVPLDISVSEFRIGEKRYFTGIVRDITEKKRKAQQDRERLDQLAHASRLSMMGEMASGLAHELNQPLTAIASYIQACRRLLKAGSGHNPRLEVAMENAEKQALLAGQIVHRMREFVSAHKIHKSTVDINALILDAVALCAAECRQRFVCKTFDLAPNLPCVHADSVYIEQVLLNLFRNSIEAMASLPAGTERLLSVKTRLNDAGDIEVTVEDNGPGIQDGHRDHVFAPFYTTKQTGMGLGLSISRSIIESHGGRLWAEENPERGAAFHFSLPVARHEDAYE